MSSNKQRRQAAQRHLQRQLERRAEQAKKRRRNLLVGLTVLAVLVVAGAVVGISGFGGSDQGATEDSSAAGATPSTAAVVDGADGSCDFTPDTSGNPNLTEVGVPPAEVTPTGTEQVAMTTNVGAIGLTLDRAAAPCAAASFDYLIGQGYFDNTPCHRETDSEGLQVLQCGDPSGTGQGGPAYQYPTQVTGSETYPRGTLAMANSGQGFDGSQFFLVYGDSQLPPSYTVVGAIDEAGLAVLDTIAANGNDGSNGPGDGAPTQPVTIESMMVTG